MATVGPRRCSGMARTVPCGSAARRGLAAGRRSAELLGGRARERQRTATRRGRQRAEEAGIEETTGAVVEPPVRAEVALAVGRHIQVRRRVVADALGGQLRLPRAERGELVG